MLLVDVWMRLSLDLSGPLSLPGRGHGDVSIEVLGARYFGGRSGEDDFDVTGVALVRVDSTVGSVSPSSGFLEGSAVSRRSARQSGFVLQEPG